jgi:GMP synthase-like glutamine amidotransferase
MKIGLSQRILYHRNRAYDSLDQSWYAYLEDHMLTFIPNNLKQDFQKLADSIDLLIITGGDDSVLRRTVETKLSAEMLKQSKPIIGVCHGSFLLIDLLGGSVVPVDRHSDTVHNIWYRGSAQEVNSYHNQTISRIHTSGKILALDDDGNVESWIDGKIAGVTWHPERMIKPWLPEEIEDFLRG